VISYCESCGMPMGKPEEHGGADPSNKWCRYCSNPDGTHKTREEVRKGWVAFAMNSEGISREDAEKKIDQQMATLPAWRK